MTPEEDLYRRLSEVKAVKPTAPTEGSGAEKEILKGDPAIGSPVTLRNVFTHHDVHPVVLDFALLRMFGTDWLHWEAETVWQEIQRAFKNQISEHARAKVQTIKTIHTSSMPWNKWQVFEKIIQGLNNNIPRWEVMQAPTIEQLYVGIDIMSELNPHEFSEEVKAYVAASALHDEVIFLPPPLEEFQKTLSRPYLHCKDCGNDEDHIHDDNACSSCTRRYAQEHGLGFSPDNGTRPGTNTEILLTYNPSEVEARWKKFEHVATDKADLDHESTADIVVAKLLVARDYLNVRRRQLIEQLTSLKSWLGSE